MDLRVRPGDLHPAYSYVVETFVNYNSFVSEVHFVVPVSYIFEKAKRFKKLLK